MLQKIGMIGECMLELSPQSEVRAEHRLAMNLSYGGDTLNCAVYLARQGVDVDFITALGDDPMSDWMIDQWRQEGVGCEFVERKSNAVPGMYLIETDSQGERSFYYWRDSAPARNLLDDPEVARQMFSRLKQHSYLCLSGITLAIYSESARSLLLQLLGEYRSNGGKVVFDGNYRPNLWDEKSAVQRVYEAMYRNTDVALPTIEDEQLIFGDADQGEIIRRLQAWGVGEILLKMGESGCLAVADKDMELVPANKVTVVDTTSAGDSFNAGYLAARLDGASVPDAARAGHSLAAVVIQHRGAIIPRAIMPGNESYK